MTPELSIDTGDQVLNFDNVIFAKFCTSLLLILSRYQVKDMHIFDCTSLLVWSFARWKNIYSMSSSDCLGLIHGGRIYIEWVHLTQVAFLQVYFSFPIADLAENPLCPTDRATNDHIMLRYNSCAADTSTPSHRIAAPIADTPVVSVRGSDLSPPLPARDSTVSPN